MPRRSPHHSTALIPGHSAVFGDDPERAPFREGRESRLSRDGPREKHTCDDREHKRQACRDPHTASARPVFW